MLSTWYASYAAQIAGVDEAGRGSLAGPVVAAAVVLNPKKPITGLNDSKKLSEKKREQLYVSIQEHALAVGVSAVVQARIDQTNILKASLEAMLQAFEQVQKMLGQVVMGALVDGSYTMPISGQVIQHAIVGGDGIWPPIMAASIVAKVVRDRFMVEQAQLYPEYGFELHKGYGTQMHLDNLKRHGPCPLHRYSFAPVAQLGLF